MQICMYGYAGDIGAEDLASKNIEKMKERFSPSFIRDYILKDNAGSNEKCICINGSEYIPDEIIDSEIYLQIKDGVYQTLWTLGEMLASGLEVEQLKIPIKQETIEICEILDISPYEIPSRGYVYVMPDGEIPLIGNVIGKTRFDNDRVIIMKEVTRFLNKKY